MAKIFQTLLLFSFLLTSLSTPLRADSPIVLGSITYEERTKTYYYLNSTAINSSDKPYEITLRGELAFYEKLSPKGDIPAFTVKKDFTLVLKAGESRILRISMIVEGGIPKGSFEIKPYLRIRRARPWLY